jgi:methyl-accepting chemotaxis protein
VFEGLFDREDFTSSHLFVVLCTGLAFFAAQLVLSVRFYFRMRRQEKNLNRLCQDLENGRTDHQEPHGRTSGAGWVQWVLSNYPAATGAPCNFSRDDAMQELDTRIAGSGDYLLLQRMGVMAPLLGVVLTVIGFYWLQIGEQEQSLQAIMLAVAPLVSGVGAGAVLALINQALLHIAGHRAESLRMAARNWFDTAIWSHVDSDTRTTAGRAVAAMDQLNAAIVDSSGRYALSASHLHESTASMNRAASQFHEMVQSFGAEIKGMPEAMADVRRATTASADALEELIRVGSRVVADLDVSVSAFRTTIDRKFAAAAKLQHRSGRILTKSARQIEDATGRLQSGSQSLQETAHANQLSFERLDDSLRKHVHVGNQHFRDTIQELSHRVEGFSHEVSALSAIVGSITGEFNKVSGGLAPSVISLREAIDNRFVGAVSRQTEHVESVNQSMQRLQDAANGISHGLTTLNAMLGEMSQFVSQTRAMHETLAQVVSASGPEPARRADQATAASQHAHAIDEVSASLERFTRHLSEFVLTGIDPATHRLAVLQDTLADFEDAYGDLEVLPANDGPTSHGNDLGGAETESQRGLLAWLSRRPR